MKKLTKEKEQKLKELSNKYFWEQKTNEVAMFLLIVGGIIVVLYLIGSIMLRLDPTIEGGIFVAGLMGLFILLLGGMIITLVGVMIYKAMEYWIESNEEKAERRAKDELGIKYEKQHGIWH